MYLERHLAPRFAAYLRQFPCVLLLGARQVGKSTFLRQTLSGWQQVDLEQPSQAALVAEAPELFLRDHPQQVWFDEAQRLPELFTALRHAIDQDRRPGRFVLSGSASPALVRGVSEYLAGRAGILHLGPFTAAEQASLPAPTFLESLSRAANATELLNILQQPVPAVVDLRALWLRGGYPEPALLADPVPAWRWFDSYIRTLSERDLSAVARGLTPATLDRLLRMAAARHGQCLSIADFARDLGLAPRTAAAYLDALEGAFLWRRLPPYLANLGKRLVKSPKACLVDSGLLHHLLHVHDLNTLDTHPLLGASWEGWVGEQLIRQAELLEPGPALFHWRTQAGAEIDLVAETRGGHLLPIEIKHTSRINAFVTRSLRQFLSDFAGRAPFGVIIYRGETLARIAENLLLIPVEKAILSI
ncbi:MAG: ATP-binding protein [Candidatus Latescibacteria bacterium]|nr:ATP-binding protein [Candidatus Latescibacterota bacterium]